MRLLAKLSETLFRLLSKPYLQTFEESSPEKILKLSLNLIGNDTAGSLRDFVRSRHTPSGGFADRAGKPDLYYTLFGYFVAEAAGMEDLFPSIRNYVGKQMEGNNIRGVHLHCAAILSSELDGNSFRRKFFRERLRSSQKADNKKQPAYNTFLNLLSSYYTGDYAGIFRMRNQLESLENISSLPGPVLAAYLVLCKIFRKPVEKIRQDLLAFYQDDGGFKAVTKAPVTDLLSTAVALYALKFAGHDLRIIKPECLNYVDSLFIDGGFGGNALDPEPDIEYTFYGLLALGSLAD
jgi:prenyltransferase beta subunit